MKVMEMLANKWATSDGCGAGDISMEVIEEIAFEAGYKAACEELRSEAAHALWVDEDVSGVTRYPRGWAVWLERDEEV